MTVHLIYKDYQESISFPYMDDLLSKLLEQYDDGDIPSQMLACHAEKGLIGNDELRELLKERLEENEADMRHKNSLAAGDEKC